MDQIVSLMDSDPEISQTEIAAKLNITQSRVSTLYREALEFLPVRTVIQNRALMMMENREAVDRVLDVLRGDHPYVSEGRIIHEVIGHTADNRPVYGEPLQDVKPILQAATTLTALHVRLSNWIGADAPKRLETANLHVKAEDLRISPIVEQFRALNARTQDQITSRVSSRRELAAGAPASSQGAGTRPEGAWHHRRRGFGANPRRAEAWDWAALVE